MMIGDRKAEGGFFEAIVAMMIVTVAVTALFGHLVNWNQNMQSPNDLISPFLDLEVRLTEDGLMPEGAEALMQTILDRDDVIAIALEMGLATQDGIIVWRCILGEPGLGDVVCTRASILIDFPGGVRMPASYLLTVWHVN